MTIKEFIDKNYDTIRQHFYMQALEMGYKESEQEDYFNDCKKFVFVGTVEELLKEADTTERFVIVRENDMVIAEMFNGISYDFIQ